MKRRALVASALALPFAASAQPAWQPRGPITVIVPNPPGGGTDFAARLYVEGLSQALGVPVVVENRGGANGNIGILATVRAPADGHTLLLQYNGYHAGNPAMMSNLQWDPLRDLKPVGMATMAPHGIFVSPQVPSNTLREFITWAKERPGGINYASSGTGSIQHIAGVLFGRATGVEVTHVPYRGAAPALQDVAGGRIELFITTPSSAIALAQAGRVKALAIAGSARAAGLPDVPTTAEAGLPGFALDAWFAFFAPTGIPEAARQRLNAELRRLADDPTIRARAEAGGAATRAMTLAELDALAEREVRELGEVIRSAGITLD
ncbi:Bug family tripartite tricarboxylate transporter substrate binding protein [Sabulicella rubraurantiaca]|uniref:Bug family tripartite tricarboxylate transporter substrate binding protein n=1 Tax=Sabulicella rubraurantiaca TaxID=2811429 RepID=UPI001A95D383|nr:tripartite tricarboxylate transporter substrate binding protein [Sabulicella rubraurantiaca]